MNTIQKQIALLTSIQALSAAATTVDSSESEILVYYRDAKTGNILPIADEKTQSSFMGESMLEEIRSGILETMDNQVALLDSQGMTISGEVLAELQSTKA